MQQPSPTNNFNLRKSNKKISNFEDDEERYNDSPPVEFVFDHQIKSKSRSLLR